jgi:hypothetical protein
LDDGDVRHAADDSSSRAGSSARDIT